MSEEIGKIEKPPVSGFSKGRKLCFVPMIYYGESSPADFRTLLNKYWEQVEKQIAELEAKLGTVSRIYHELIPAGGEAGSMAIKELHEQSYHLVRLGMEKGARLEALEDGELLTEFLDWNRCLAAGLQNEKVFTSVYESFIAAGKKRNDGIASRIDATLKPDEIGVLLMREGHQVQFPTDIQVIYVAPPALDEIKRWFREREAKPPAESPEGKTAPPA